MAFICHFNYCWNWCQHNVIKTNVIPLNWLFWMRFLCKFSNSLEVSRLIICKWFFKIWILYWWGIFEIAKCGRNIYLKSFEYRFHKRFLKSSVKKITKEFPVVLKMFLTFPQLPQSPVTIQELHANFNSKDNST